MRSSTEKDSSSINMWEILKEYQSLERERMRRSGEIVEEKWKSEEKLEEEYWNRIWEGIRNHFPESFDKRILWLEHALEGINFQWWFVMQSLKWGHTYTSKIDCSNYDWGLEALYEKVKSLDWMIFSWVRIEVGMSKAILDKTADQLIKENELSSEDADLLNRIIQENEWGLKELYNKIMSLAAWSWELLQVTLYRLGIIAPWLKDAKDLKDFLDKIAEDQIYIIFKKTDEKDQLKAWILTEEVSESIWKLVQEKQP
ncbi:MAG: hypothetical protein ACD_3C00226G0013 [uncultured bacterium (gcode 4)]|uniref:Uncharacterized protein n=1 Tax=uncultured bacterium (gcode 4) TaxID=1234023 RepID=K2GAU5_9BACT|nr:MAG: hypothetical protein ACD_3C00226G0013 [uncultured bacterium (gcode 4)]